LAKGIFQLEYNLRASDFDKFRQIKISSVMDIFQDIAGRHAEELGIGFYSMLEKNLLWVIMKVKLEIISMPQMYQRVVAVTWPKEPKRLDFERNYLIKDTDGNVLIKGTSQWAVIDSNTRKLTRASDVYTAIDEFVTESTFDERIMRVSDFDDGKNIGSVTSTFSEIDSNGHVNNVRYADYIINALMPEKPLHIRKVQIDFHKEIMAGESTDILFSEEENTLLFKGVQGENVMFCAKIER
jgi:acyl-ACP thioesterase